MNTSSKFLTALAVSVLLTACPGSGGDSSSSTTTSLIVALAYDSQNATVYIANAGRSTIQNLNPGALTNQAATLAGGDNVTGTTNGDGTAARFNYPYGLLMADTTTLVVSDTGNSILRKITSLTGTKTVANYAAAGSFNNPSEMAASTTDIYVADSNNHVIKKVSLTSQSSENWSGTSGVSGATDGASSVALFKQPQGIAIDTANSVVYVSDTSNHTIRKITIGGTNPVAIIAGVAGTSGYKNSATGTTANFNFPTSLVFSGNALYVTDTGNNAIRRIDTTGTNAVTTFAGSAGTIDLSLTAVSGSTDGTGTTARFYLPRGIALNASNPAQRILYVGDQNGTKLRKILIDADPADATKPAALVETFTTTF